MLANSHVGPAVVRLNEPLTQRKVGNKACDIATQQATDRLPFTLGLEKQNKGKCGTFLTQEKAQFCDFTEYFLGRGTDFLESGNPQNLQELTAPSQEIVRHVTHRKTTTYRSYT